MDLKELCRVLWKMVKPEPTFWVGLVMSIICSVFLALLIMVMVDLGPILQLVSLLVVVPTFFILCNVVTIRYTLEYAIKKEETDKYGN